MSKPRIVRRPRTGDRDRWTVRLPCGCALYTMGPGAWETMRDLHRRIARDVKAHRCLPNLLELAA